MVYYRLGHMDNGQRDSAVADSTKCLFHHVPYYYKKSTPFLPVHLYILFFVPISRCFLVVLKMPDFHFFVYPSVLQVKHFTIKIAGFRCTLNFSFSLIS